MSRSTGRQACSARQGGDGKGRPQTGPVPKVRPVGTAWHLIGGDGAVAVVVPPESTFPQR